MSIQTDLMSQLKLYIMFSTVRFPVKDTDFDSYVVSVIIYILTLLIKTRLAILPANETLLVEDVSDWSKNRVKALDPNQCTTAIINEQKRLKAKIKVDFPSVLCKINPDILTVADRFALRLFLRNSNSVNLVASWCPLFIVNFIAHLLIKLKFINTDAPNSKKMPKGNKIYLEQYIGLPNLADENIVFGGGVNVSKAFYTMNFKDADSGKTLYLRGYYENRRGDRGPVSLIMNVIIP